jgi:tetratricopeptide (TPR) repeat protein
VLANPPAAAASANAAAPRVSINVQLKAQGDNVVLRFPFPQATPAAVFRRADTLWLVFDTDADFKLDELGTDSSHNIRGATAARRLDASIVRIKLERPKLTSVAMEGSTWVVTIGSESTAATRALGVVRSGATSALATATITMNDPRAVHRLQDPEAGDMLLVVTALPPARGFINGQEFVEFRLLSSTQGIVVQPLADDLSVELSPDRVTLSRPSGLTLSSLTLQSDQAPAEERPSVLSPDLWDSDRKEEFGKRESQLLFTAAKASEAQRLAARVDLARFYLAWERSAEAKGVLDVALKDNPPTAADPVALVLRAVADLMLERPQEALKDLGSPVVGNQFDAPLWRAWAYSRLSRWADASDGFRDLDARIAHLPIGLQQRLLRQAVRVAIAVGDITGATGAMHEFEVIGVPPELLPIMTVYNGKLAERLGHLQDALQDYRIAADSSDRLAAAQGTLRRIALESTIGRLGRPSAIEGLETLTSIWRGDEVEIEALRLLAHLYTQEGRYRDSFHVMRTALTAHPSSELTRGIQDEASETFENLFLSGSGDALSAIDALALFYDFRDLTPIGRRGDEMIRRLSDRLVAVDLLDQAAELLQYQVDRRLQGAARAQVAMRLAVIYLMNHKPEDAFSTLRATRVEDVSTEMRQQRLLVESRALSDMGRYDVALDVIANVPGKEAQRLRSDILWTAHRWQEAAEQMERIYGDRWKEFAPLNDVERADILRAGAGYALAGDTLGLSRFRERYVGKMGDGPDRRAFDVITEPVDASGADFRAVAHSVAAVDTLSSFLRDLQARYPQTGALPPAGTPPPPDNAPTGSIPRPPSRPSGPLGRTASR